MIGLVNNSILEPSARKIVLQRALVTRPIFIDFQTNLLELGTEGITIKRAAKFDYEVFLVNAQSNLSENAQLGATLAGNVEIYTTYKDSLYRSNSNRRTLRPYVMTNARNFNKTAIAYDDRQREFMPFRINQTDTLIVETFVENNPVVDVTIWDVLSGFLVTPNIAYPQTPIEQFKESLSRPIDFDWFNLEIDHIGHKEYRFHNDNKPRLLLGFSATTLVDLFDGHRSLIQITDYDRRIQFNENPIPLEFFAPLSPMVYDQYVYYLPIEYYLEPYADLIFAIDNEDQYAYNLNILTRTI